MKIAILGYGKEGQSAEKYFQSQNPDNTIVTFSDFTNAELEKLNLTDYDLIIRSPSVYPLGNWSSVTKYFFEHCPCPIIGVTGTKGKGTTSSIITSILRELGKTVHLVGNIGTPALDILDNIQGSDVAVYEMSSFQLWDLKQSPHIAVILHIEPDHLNIHDDFADYISAKSNITKYQTPQDYCIYNQNNPTSAKISAESPAKKLPYPIESLEIVDVLNSLTIPGQHNRENTQAALLAVAAYYDIPVNQLIEQYSNQIKSALQSFQGLPHRLQFLRTLNNVSYYDDNFATGVSSTKVALDAFPNTPLVLIAGGRDKTNNTDLPELVETLNNTKNIQKIILIGESGHELAKLLPEDKYSVQENLADATLAARQAAESIGQDAIVLMSPAAASFDMFKNVYDRGDQFQACVKELQ